MVKKLIINNISVDIEDKKIIKDISMHINEGELVSILGISGAGKTTLFNAIAGLLNISKGNIILDGIDITGQKGKMSYMLQKDLLLPFKTIIENISLPLIIKGINKKEAYKEVNKYIDTFGLNGYENLYPSSLSGGMKQRAALLRTYMFSNNIALLDEPFSALDAITKSEMHKWYINIMKNINLTTLFITHDIDEAILLSNRIYILGKKDGIGYIQKEILINLKNNKDLLSDDFIAYKKEILESLNNIK